MLPKALLVSVSIVHLQRHMAIYARLYGGIMYRGKLVVIGDELQLTGWVQLIISQFILVV